MPRKILDLIGDPTRAGFSMKSGKGSHRKFSKKGRPTVIISGKSGDDAKPYQEQDVKKAIGDTP